MIQSRDLILSSQSKLGQQTKVVHYLSRHSLSVSQDP